MAGGPVPLKGLEWSKDGYGFCAYPAGDEVGGRPVFIVGPCGVYKRTNGGNLPVLKWHNDQERGQNWAICD